MECLYDIRFGFTDYAGTCSVQGRRSEQQAVSVPALLEHPENPSEVDRQVSETAVPEETEDHSQFKSYFFSPAMSAFCYFDSILVVPSARLICSPTPHPPRLRS